MKKYRSIKSKITARIVFIGILTFTIPLILSWFFIVPSLEKAALESAETISGEIIQKLDSHINYVMDYTETLALSVEQNHQIIAYFNAPDIQTMNIAALDLNKLVSNNGVARAVVIESADGSMLNSLNQITQQDYAQMDSTWYQNISSANYAQGVSSPYATLLNGKMILTAAYVKNFHFRGNKFTYTVFFNLDEVIYASDQISENILDEYLLVDNDDTVFYAWGSSTTQINLDTNIANAKKETEEKGVSFTITSINSKWKVVTFVSAATTIKSYQNYIVTFFFIMLSFLVITLIAIPKSIFARCP